MTENEQKMTTVFHLQEYAQRSRNTGTRMHLLIFFLPYSKPHHHDFS